MTVSERNRVINELSTEANIIIEEKNQSDLLRILCNYSKVVDRAWEYIWANINLKCESSYKTIEEIGAWCRAIELELNLRFPRWMEDVAIILNPSTEEEALEDC